MKRKLDSIAERLEYLELAKLRKEYEEKGFQFTENKRIKRNGTFIFLDAYARHPDTYEEVIFEVKAVGNESPEYKAKLRDQIQSYKNVFPKSRIVLVSVKEKSLPELEVEFIEEYLYSVIRENYEREIRFIIGSDFKKMEAIEKLTYEVLKVSYRDKIKVRGSAHLIISTGTELNTIKYEIPFRFEGDRLSVVSDLRNLIREPQIKINFDFFEFT